MACRNLSLKTSDGKPFYGIVCGPRGRKPSKCAYCLRPHTKLCDFVVRFVGAGEFLTVGKKVGDPVTCDTRICGQCSRHTEPDTDVCRIHPFRPVTAP